ncbi:MAG: calcium/sodium antiporter [Clostridia bacterium]|nr:calcium/sodium antiporter [Clostridia bacterium]
MSIFISVVLIILGFVFLIKGADFLVDGASGIAKRLNIPEIIIGLTIVSIGTTMPELIVSVSSAIRGSSDMAIGNVIGSNVCNMLLILGLVSVIKSIEFKKETRTIDVPLLLIFTIIFTVICNTGAWVTKSEGIILLSLFVLFIIYTVIMSRKALEYAKEEKEIFPQERTKRHPILKNIINIIIGIIILKIGGDLTIDNAVTVAQKFNISEKIIGLTILAVGTSLPELVTGITATLKGSSDIGIGNIIGANIFNMLLITGITSMINPIVYNTTYNIQIIILILAIFMLALFPVIPPKNEMSRGNGITYLIWYGIYMVILLNV